MNFTALVFDMMAFLAPLAPVAIGVLATEYVGSLNIALEGLILAGAFTYIAVGSVLGPFFGAMAALVFSSWLAFSADLFARKTRADSFVVGLGINMLVPALASILSQFLFGTKGVAVVAGLQSSRYLSQTADIPVLGLFLGHRISDYLALALTVVIGIMLSMTPFALRTKAAGMNPDSLKMAGLDSGRVRGLAYAISGLACGATGAALAASVGAWVPNMSAGRGWIALVAVYLGGKNLLGTIIATSFFSLLLSLATRAQSIQNAPPELLMALPYFVTALVVVMGAARYRKSSPGRKIGV